MPGYLNACTCQCTVIYQHTIAAPASLMKAQWRLVIAKTHSLTHTHKRVDKDKQKQVGNKTNIYKMSYHIVDMTDPAEPEPVVLAKHAKNLLRFLHLLPARMSSHDNTR